jgi:hypothetical protein
VSSDTILIGCNLAELPHYWAFRASSHLGVRTFLTRKQHPLK